jgi:hypothetical protein
MDPTMLDLTWLRQTEGDEGAANAFYSYMAGKHAPNGMDSEYTMSQIGG